MRTEKKLSKIGNSKGVIIDKLLLEILGIKDHVELIFENNQIIIKKPSERNDLSDRKIV